MSPHVESPGPILCAPLLRKVDDKLVELLRSLALAEWDLPTVAPMWKVRDVAAHLLDTALRKLSIVRDGWVVDAADGAPEDLVAMINRLNQQGVAVYRRLSPNVLIGLMQVACGQYARFHESLDPFAPAAFAVSWAGEETSLNWFDTARELTERWHHQQQIRLATNRPGILTPELYHPVLDCFARGLPHLFRDATAPPTGAMVQMTITGDCGGQWFLFKTATEWQLVARPTGMISARVTIPQELAWRIFTKGVDRRAALGEVEIAGDWALAERVLQLTAIVG